MRFQDEFTQIRTAFEAALSEAAKGREGFDSAAAADDVLHLIENRINAVDRAIVAACHAIEAGRKPPA